MTDLSIHLLGTFHVSHQGQAVSGFRSERDRALLAFLAVERDRPHRREELLGIMWPDMPEEQARNNLRVNLHRLRKVLQHATGIADLLLVGRNAVQVNPAADIWLDVTEFQTRLMEANQHVLASNPAGPERLRQLAKAAALYRDEFLKGFIFEHSPAFDHWATAIREKLLREALHTLSELAEVHQLRGELQVAAGYARRQLELEPWREKAHQQLMGILARRGERGAALAQFQICHQVLEEEFGVEPSIETMRIYDRIRAAREQRLVNFPSQPAPLIGRKEELATITAQLADPACRLFTLTGPGGIGKTRLALQAAERQADAFLDGVVFIPLVGVSAPEYLVSAMTDALALSSQGKGDLKKQLLDYLREKEILLVLDNFEHLLKGAELLGDILRSAPETKMIITSRARLNLPWEWLFEMDGLRYPEGEEDDAVDNYSAVQLFMQSAKRVLADFSLSNEKDDVVHACRLLEGMPLGIELAAARVREYSCREIAERIQQNLDFLATSMRGVSPRHRSLRAAFEHSWNLLSEEEKRVFRKLSIFRAGFDRAAAEKVADAPFDMLSSFVDKSLLRRTRPPNNTNPVRYDLHELIQQFADEKLAEAPIDGDILEKETLQDLHCKYYANFLREREKYMRGEKTHTALFEVHSEIENVRAAWRWAVEHNRVKETRNFLWVMLLFYEIQGWFWEAENAYRMTVQCFDRLVQNAAEPNTELLLGLGWALFHQGWYAMRISQYEKAEALYKRGMDIAHSMGDRNLETYCLDGLGVTAKLKGEFTVATTYLKKCYGICKEIGNEWLAGGALGNLGDIAMMQGEYEEARRLVQESLEIQKRDGDKWGIATRTNSLGEIAARKGEYTQAEALLKESLVVFEEIGQQWRMADSFNSLAKIASKRGDYAKAQAYYQESLSRVWETGNRDRIALTLSLLGDTNLAFGNPQAARRNFQEALHLAVEVQADPVTLRALLGMATLLAQEEKEEKAVELLAGVIHHPAVEQSVKERAEILLHELKGKLAPKVMTAASNRGKEQELDKLAAECLGAQ